MRYNYDYQGEYRVRVTLADPPIQMESEDNNVASSADLPRFTVPETSRMLGIVAGYVSVADSYDYFALGNLVTGTVIRTATRIPGSSGLEPKVEILYGSSTVLPDQDGNPNDGAALVTAAANGAYYVRLSAKSGAGLLAQYLLDIELADTAAPTITSVSPACGGRAQHSCHRSIHRGILQGHGSQRR
jgi:hypothetical protein